MKELIVNPSFPSGTIVVDENTKINNFPFGIWANVKDIKKDYIPKGPIKLMETNAGGVYFAFYKIDGTHAGWGNHNSLKECLSDIRQYYTFVAPETKQELLNLLKDNL
jgi:hypothetical protein